jgi:hypothetical protein
MKKIYLILFLCVLTIGVYAQQPPSGTKSATSQQFFVYKNLDTTRLFGRFTANGISAFYKEFAGITDLTDSLTNLRNNFTSTVLGDYYTKTRVDSADLSVKNLLNVQKDRIDSIETDGVVNTTTAQTVSGKKTWSTGAVFTTGAVIGSDVALKTIPSGGTAFVPKFGATAISGMAGLATQIEDGTNNPRAGLFIDATNSYWGLGLNASATRFPFMIKSGSAVHLSITTSGVVNIPNLAASLPMFTDASKNLVSTGVVPILNGGTGSTTATGSGSVVLQNSPTFSGTPIVPTPASNINTNQIVNGAWANTYYTPLARTLTINSVTQDLSTNRSWTVGTVTSVVRGYGMSIQGAFSTSGTVAIDPAVIAPLASPSFSGTTKITVVEYADNAAAITGGLAVGSVYRTGDIMKIVH